MRDKWLSELTVSGYIYAQMACVCETLRADDVGIVEGLASRFIVY